MVPVQPAEGGQRGVAVLRLARGQVHQDRQPHRFVHPHCMVRHDMAGDPVPLGRGDLRLTGGCADPLRDATIAAEGVGLDHGVEVAQSALGAAVHVKRAHGHGAVGVGPHQGVEDPLLAGGRVPGHQGAAHLRLGPKVESLRLVLLPVDQGGSATIHPVDHQRQSPRGFLDQGVVVQHEAQVHQAVEPVGTLFQGPARAVGGGRRRGDRCPLPGVVEHRVIFVQMARDPLSRRHGPIAQPAGRLDGARRQGQQRRRNGQGMRPRVGRWSRLGRQPTAAERSRQTDPCQQQHDGPCAPRAIVPPRHQTMSHDLRFLTKHQQDQQGSTGSSMCCGQGQSKSGRGFDRWPIFPPPGGTKMVSVAPAA